VRNRSKNGRPLERDLPSYDNRRIGILKRFKQRLGVWGRPRARILACLVLWDKLRTIRVKYFGALSLAMSDLKIARGWLQSLRCFWPPKLQPAGGQQFLPGNLPGRNRIGETRRSSIGAPLGLSSGPRFCDRQMDRTPEDSWREYHLYARSLPGHQGSQDLLEEIRTGKPNHSPPIKTKTGSSAK
jgi:hypothetical protein